MQQQLRLQFGHHPQLCWRFSKAAHQKVASDPAKRVGLLQQKVEVGEELFTICSLLRCGEREPRVVMRAIDPEVLQEACHRELQIR